MRFVGFSGTLRAISAKKSIGVHVTAKRMTLPNTQASKLGTAPRLWDRGLSLALFEDIEPQGHVFDQGDVPLDLVQEDDGVVDGR